MSNTTVIIKTIGRDSLKAAVHSAKREGFKPIIISDGYPCKSFGCRVVQLGKNWGFYGGMAANVGAALAETEFITFLDDDDVFLSGAGDIIRSKLQEKPEVDVWIGGVRFNQKVIIHNKLTGEIRREGYDFAISPELGIGEGNVAMPTYRTDIFRKVPFTDSVPEEYIDKIDLLHVNLCKQAGYKIDWFGEPLYHVRPHLKHLSGESSVNGRGQ